MSTVLLHPAPTYRRVFREQMRAVGLRLRVEGILFAGFIVISAILTVISMQRATPTDLRDMGLPITLDTVGANARDSSSHLYISMDSTGLHASNEGSGTIDWTIVKSSLIYSFFSGFIWPLFWIFSVLLPSIIWRSENPARRSYHWVMPIPRRGHAIMKVASGWLWLMFAIAVCVLYSVLLLSYKAFHYIPPHMSWGQNWIRVLQSPMWDWVCLLLSSTILYLCSSSLFVASDHPRRWMLGFLILFFAGATYVAIMEQPPVEQSILTSFAHFLKTIAVGPYGFFNATITTNAKDTFSYFANVALWIVASGIGVWFAAGHHAEPREE